LISRVRVTLRASGPRRLDRPIQRSPLSSRLLLTAVISLVAMMAVGCSSSSSTPSSTSTPPVSTAPNSEQPSNTGVATGGLSGTWSGQYSGASQGTFTLTWQQSGSKLNGTITLSDGGVTLPINGTIDGSDIRFGTVGSLGVTYSGTVSGNSMSGTYQSQTGNGPWSAAKTS
jgi:hypothetical protein